MENLLKKASLKNTKQRSYILSVIMTSEGPIAAEEIYKSLLNENKKINLSTVYRTINVLSEKGVLLKTIREDGTASYQLNDLSHNHYLTCCVCHSSVLMDDCPIVELSERISKETGYKVTGHSLQLIGVCPNCLKNNYKK
ncbi:Fur family transcriptional regulator [Sedimentibacter sp. MB31-C6]|uniref:Fur family transcriptional regulator n=1 Tax=Sedimentibacter sp. MB31-C6 TaxID=3109366 RepID=UPI002DDD2381|nr:transcriptional repressor [Sedimentibacter sp. MB36-C1]WSI05525.1 transcriptional repressor [Sedimentibacter sp. MB36-C1]